MRRSESEVTIWVVMACGMVASCSGIGKTKMGAGGHLALQSPLLASGSRGRVGGNSGRGLKVQRLRGGGGDAMEQKAVSKREEEELEERRLNLKAPGGMIGPGTYVAALHAANKALMCWCTRAEARESIMKVSDVGFLGLLGGLALTCSFAPAAGLASAQVMILQTGLAHLSFECVYNGILMPRMARGDKNGTVAVASSSSASSSASSPGVAVAAADLTKAARPQSTAGLRPDIWLHHGFALGCFSIVLTTGEFLEEAVMLTAVEATCALPVAFTQAAQGKILKGARSIALAGLMVGGFTLRVLLSSHLTLPRVYGLGQTVIGGKGDAEPVRSASGEEYGGSMMEWHRAGLVGGSLGLTVLNTLWLGKIVQGAYKVLVKRRGGTTDGDRDRDPPSVLTPVLC